jgi:hypothetical protein
MKAIESDIVKKVKAERLNPGRNYKDYLSPSERAKLKKHWQIGRPL